MDAFRNALDFTLSFEGGYSNDPDDPGGATNFGVTQRVYDARRDLCGLPRRSVKEITRPEVENIYCIGYWDASGCARYSPHGMAVVVFDTAVNFGVGRAKEFVGKLSKRALGDMLAGDVRTAANEIVAMRIQHRADRVASNPSQVKFLKGWLSRDTALLKATR